MTSDAEQIRPRPPGLRPGWTARVPQLDDLDVLVELRGADRLAHTGSGSVDREAIQSEVAGPASWTRRQLLAIDPEGARGRGSACTTARAPHDGRAVRRPLAGGGRRRRRRPLRLGRGAGPRDLQAARGHRDAAGRQPVRRGHRAATVAGGRRLHQAPDLAADDPTGHPRGGHVAAATARGSPCAGSRTTRTACPSPVDLHLVHEMLESSFEDHFNSYRESFPSSCSAFARTRPPLVHWWLAFVDQEDGPLLAAGALVGTVLARQRGPRGQLCGVHRRAR